MSKIYNMSAGEIRTIHMEDYSENEFLIAELDFLGTNPNTHKIKISEEVFKECASSVLGKFLVAKVSYGDATGHAEDEIIQGYVPREQEVRYTRNSEQYLRGIVDVVVSKQYASEFCDIFTKSNNKRSVSVEMMVDEDADDNGTVAKSFNIIGVTVLGMMVKPSSPGSNINIRRFEEQSIEKSCENYYKSIWERAIGSQTTELDTFVKNRKVKFAKQYSINTTELKETPWGEVDKTEIREKIMDASNRSELINHVYLKVEDGWEDSPSTKLKYPVMELVNNTFYYNRFALASALAYARQHDEADVVSKVLKLYKKFKLAEEGEEENMSKAKFEIEGREAWADVIAQVQEHEGKDAYVDSIDDDYIIFTIDDVRYRVEADIEVGEDDDTVKAEIHWDTKKKDEVQDESDDEDKDDMSEDDSQSEDELSEEDAQDDSKEEECAEEDNKEMEDEEKQCAEDEDKDSEEQCAEEDSASEDDMSKDEKISELENIIMQKDEELAELRKYKEEKECAERDFAVQQLLEEIRECVDTETLETLKAEGLACKLSDIDGWKNKAKALAFDKSAKKESFTSKWSMAISQQITKKPTSKWDSVN
ncbi:MAG: hypothetical protein IKR19_02595 [Acholeplasmatales bacterium]|nr:hypothetical protein [Acholeplasmatales bacterium]